MEKLPSEGKRTHRHDKKEEDKDFETVRGPLSARIKEEKKKTNNSENSHKEVDDRYSNLERLKSMPSYASVLNNPKRNNFLAAIYAATGERSYPPEVTEDSNIADYEVYINRIQKSYEKYCRFHSSGDLKMTDK